ncbi:MAG: heavy metal-associated domain-containing protein [Polyangiales bacterium]
MSEATIKIGGMSCDGCVKAVTRALSNTPGVSGLRVTIGEAKVTLDPTARAEDLRDRVEDAGFEVLDVALSDAP